MRPLGVNAAFSVGSNLLGTRFDPYRAFNFHVEIDGLVVGGFSEVRGLEVEVEVEEYREGGRNDTVHQLPKGARYRNLTLKHGLTDVDTLWSWHQDVVAGLVVRRSLTIFLLDTNREPVAGWAVRDAWPVKWQGPDLVAHANEVAFEVVELAHAGFARSTAARGAGLARDVTSAASAGALHLL